MVRHSGRAPSAPRPKVPFASWSNGVTGRAIHRRPSVASPIYV